MRLPRFTYPEAFHHCLNRGHNGEPILARLTYKEISEFDIFADLQYAFLRQLYQNARRDLYGR